MYETCLHFIIYSQKQFDISNVMVGIQFVPGTKIHNLFAFGAIQNILGISEMKNSILICKVPSP